MSPRGKSHKPDPPKGDDDRPPSFDVVPTSVKPNAAFELWLERGLHKLFDDIAQEPLPPALLDIIEQDRRKK